MEPRKSALIREVSVKWFYYITEIARFYFVSEQVHLLVVIVYINVMYEPLHMPQVCIVVIAGFSAVLAQFVGVDHFRAVGWYNFVLGVLMIVLQFLAFHGESDWKVTYGKEIKEQFKSGLKFFNTTTLSTFLVSSPIFC